MKEEQLREQRNHGTSLFPVSYYDVHISKEFSLVPLHWHEELEVTYIQWGEAEYQIGVHTFIAKQGEFILINPQVLHRIQKIHTKEMKSQSFVFHSNLLNNVAIDSCGVTFFQPMINQTHQLPHQLKETTDGYEEVKDCFFKLVHSNESKHYGYELKMKGYIFS